MEAMTSISLLLPISSRYQESVLVDTSSADRIHSIKQDLNKMAASNHIPTSISDFVVSINRRLAFVKTTLSPDVGDLLCFLVPISTDFMDPSLSSSQSPISSEYAAIAD